VLLLAQVPAQLPLEPLLAVVPLRVLQAPHQLSYRLLQP
jgi:hypothetical protein